MRKIILILPLLILLISCERDFAPISPEPGFRAAADLSLLSPCFSDDAYTLTKAGHPFTSEILWQDIAYYLVRFNYEWQKSADQWIIVEQTVCESFEQAVCLLKNEWETSSFYHRGPRPQDYPTIAGTISYENGRTFIRDNIVIRSRILGDSTIEHAELARNIDRYLLKTPIFQSSAAACPQIIKFAISKNPVPLWSSTKLLIGIIDPTGGTLYYDWRFQPNTGGICKEVDGYYFQSYMDDPVTLFLRLIAFNSAGYSAWSEIKIEVK